MHRGSTAPPRRASACWNRAPERLHVPSYNREGLQRKCGKAKLEEPESRLGQVVSKSTLLSFPRARQGFRQIASLPKLLLLLLPLAVLRRSIAAPMDTAQRKTRRFRLSRNHTGPIHEPRGTARLRESAAAILCLALPRLGLAWRTIRICVRSHVSTSDLRRLLKQFIKC